MTETAEGTPEEEVTVTVTRARAVDAVAALLGVADYLDDLSRISPSGPMSEELVEIAWRLGEQMCSDTDVTEPAWLTEPERVEIYARNFDYSALFHSMHHHNWEHYNTQAKA